VVSLAVVGVASAQPCTVEGEHAGLGEVSIGPVAADADDVSATGVVTLTGRATSARLSMRSPLAVDLDVPVDQLAFDLSPAGVTVPGLLVALPGAFRAGRPRSAGSGVQVDLSATGLHVRAVPAACESLILAPHESARRVVQVVTQQSAAGFVVSRAPTLALAAEPGAPTTLTLELNRPTSIAFAVRERRGSLARIERSYSDGSSIRGWARWRDLRGVRRPLEPRVMLLDSIEIDDRECINPVGSWVGPAIARAVPTPVRAEPRTNAAPIASLTTRETVTVVLSADRRWASVRQAPGVLFSCGPEHAWVEATALELDVLRDSELTLHGRGPGAAAPGSRIRVTEVTRGSTAARAGVVAGDSLVSVSPPGRNVLEPSSTPLVDLREALRQSGSVVRLERGTTEVRLTIP